MHVCIRTVARLEDVPEEGTVIILYFTKMVNGVSLALDFRQADGANVTTKRLLEKSPRSEKNAIRLAKDLAAITNTRSVYIINRHDDPEKGIKAFFMRRSIDQPTTRREYRSMIIAK